MPIINHIKDNLIFFYHAYFIANCDKCYGLITTPQIYVISTSVHIDLYHMFVWYTKTNAGFKDFTVENTTRPKSLQLIHDSLHGPSHGNVPVGQLMENTDISLDSGLSGRYAEAYLSAYLLVGPAHRFFNLHQKFRAIPRIYSRSSSLNSLK